MTVLEIFQHGNLLAWDVCHPTIDVFEKCAEMQAKLSERSGLTISEIAASTMIHCSFLPPLSY